MAARNCGGINGSGDIYEAVVVIDNFNEKFHPLSDNRPEILMPLVNEPILNYTLKFLSNAGVRVVYLFCTNHAEIIQEFINSHWKKETSMQITLVISKTCLSLGDVLRELDRRATVRNDFVLLTGGVVSNLQLKPIIDEHRHYYKAHGKQLLMTGVYKHALPKHRCRRADKDVTLVVDEKSQRILHHQRTENQRKISFPLVLFQENEALSIRRDLLDCNVTICSPQFLSLFSDNFDFQTKDDFIKGILENEEILGSIIRCHITETEYAASVTNLHMYDVISQDILDRWVSPFVPDNVLTTDSPYTYLRQNVYQAKDITLARNCVLKERLIVGEGSKIGDRSCVKRSVIGRNCTIGKNVELDNAYLWDNVTIGDNCVIKSAYLANDVHLFDEVTVKSGCVLTNKVVVGPSVTLDEGTVLTAEDLNEFSEEENVDVGTKGKGFVYKGNHREMLSLVSYLTNGPYVSADEGSSTGDSSDVEASGNESDDNQLVDDSKLFYKEVLDSILRGIDEKVSWENLVLEVNSSKYAYNVTMQEVNALVTQALLEAPDCIVGAEKTMSSQEYLTALKPILDQMNPLLKNYMKSKSSQIDCLNSIEDFYCNNPNYAPTIVKLLHHSYENDVLSEEAIIDWYKTPTQHSDDPTVIREKVAPFIQWLQNAETESEEDDDDGSDEEESESD